MKYSNMLACIMILSMASYAMADDNGKTSAIKPLSNVQPNEPIIIGEGQLPILGDGQNSMTVQVKERCPIGYDQTPKISISVAGFGPNGSSKEANSLGGAKDQPLTPSQTQACFTQVAAATNAYNPRFVTYGTDALYVQFFLDTQSHQAYAHYYQKWHSGWWIFGHDHKFTMECYHLYAEQMTLNATISCVPNRS